MFKRLTITRNKNLHKRYLNTISMNYNEIEQIMINNKISNNFNNNININININCNDNRNINHYFKHTFLHSNLNLNNQFRFYSTDNNQKKNNNEINKIIQRGDRVYCHIDVFINSTNKLFDKRNIEKPTSFICGGNEILAGISNIVQGMKIGEIKSNNIILPEHAFGNYEDGLIITATKSQLQLSDELVHTLKDGMRFHLKDGTMIRIINILPDNKFKIDLNHPLAGEKLRANIEILDIIKSYDLPKEEQLVIPTEIIKEGDNKRFPKLGDRIKVHYIGYLKDNTIFDSSRDRNEPFEFILGIGQVIKGWDEGIIHMSLGQRSKLYIPLSKGYGKEGAGDVIPPNTDLIFDIELLDIVTKR